MSNRFSNPSTMPPPRGYTQVVETTGPARTIYLSGQLGIGADGKLPDGIEAQTKQALENVGAILKRAGLGYADVFHCTAMLKDMADWPAMNKVYVTYFPEGKRPARSAFGASGLALGALIELECQAYAGKK